MAKFLAPPSILCLRLVPHLPHPNPGPEICINNNSRLGMLLGIRWEPGLGLNVLLLNAYTICKR